MNEPTDPQARAEDVILGATLRWAGDAADLADCREVAALTAAALAEAGLLADLETRRFGAIFDDLDAARAELTEVKAERDSHLAALVAQGRVTDRLTWELRDACDDRGAAWRAYEIALQTGAEWQTRAEQAETELAALRESVERVRDEMRNLVEHSAVIRSDLPAALDALNAALGDQS